MRTYQLDELDIPRRKWVLRENMFSRLHRPRFFTKARHKKSIRLMATEIGKKDVFVPSFSVWMMSE